MLTTIRHDIISSFHTNYKLAFPAVPITYDNQAFDDSNIPSLFVEVEIKNYSGNQIAMSGNPKARYKGFVYVTVYMKEGTGTVKGLEILDWFAGQLGFKMFGVVQLGAPSPGDGGKFSGFRLEEMKFAYSADQP